MTNASGDRFRAIQGHTLEQLNISEQYDKIKTLENYINHPKWVGRGVPDHLVLEITNDHLSGKDQVPTIQASIEGSTP